MSDPISDLSTVARSQIQGWMRGTRITQAVLAQRIGKQQAWLSRYLAGHAEADIETLQKLAAVFGHSVSALLVQPALDPIEARLIDLYRALTPRARRIAMQLLEDWSRQAPEAVTVRSKKARV